MKTLHALTLLVAPLGLAFIAPACARQPSVPQSVHLPDADGDGIADVVDECPDSAEDGLAPQAKDGCPVDADGDGVKGKADQCPDKPETWNGFKDEDGCPDDRPAVATVAADTPKEAKGIVVTKDEIKIDEEILFEIGSAKIDKSSDDLVARVAKVIAGHVDVQFVEIAGHADERGAEKRNNDLTRARATSVMEHLVKDGVDPKRLRAAGYGAYCALDAGHTEAAYAKNRRVEFRILRRNGKELATKWGGCDKALAKGMKPEPIPGTAPNGALDEKPVVAAKPREVELPTPFVGDLEIARQDACKKGKLDQCNALGLQYESGNGAIRDLGKAFAAYKTACDGGNLDGCANVGGVYEDGRGVPGDYASAQLAYTIACAKGEMAGCDGLGSIYENGHGVAIDLKKSATFYRQACDGGVAPACLSEGEMRLSGRGLDASREEGVELIRTSCQWGYQLACQRLQALVATPATTIAAKAKTPPHACVIGELDDCLDQCQDGSAVSCHTLGLMYAYGVTVKAAPARAITFFSKAGTMGHLRGWVHVGLLTEMGLGAAADAKAALELYKRACDGGEAQGCTNQGLLTASAKLGVAADFGAAAALYKRACDAHEGNACERLGWLQLEGKGVAADPARAVALFRLACEEGIPTSCEARGYVSEKGLGVGKSLSEGNGFYEESCHMGYKLGCDRWHEEQAAAKLQADVSGKLCKLGDVAVCTEKCNGNDAEACLTLGLSLEYGRGAAVDFTAAKARFEQSLAGGNARAAVYLGLLLEGGVGVTADASAAVALYQRACSGRAWAGCTNMGRLYLSGRGVAASDESARANFKLACDNGEGTGCDWLATLYVDGRGVRVDLSVAASLFERGCQLGVATSCEAVGTMKAKGTGVAVDRVGGIAWVKLSCDRGFQLACDALGSAGTCAWNDPEDCVRLCDHGSAASCYKLGHMYKAGIVVSVDDSKAALYFEKAYAGSASLSCPGGMVGVQPASATTPAPASSK